MKHSWFALLAITLIVTACGGKEEAILSGDRISLLGASQRELPERNVREPLLIIPQVKNDTWSQLGQNAAHSGGHLMLAESVTPAWSHSIGGGTNKRTALLTPPVAFEGLIYTLNTEGVVSAVSVEQGKTQWRKRLPQQEKAHLKYSGGLAVAAEKIVISTGGGEVIALNRADGEIAWQQRPLVPIRAAPTIADGRVFVLGHNNQLFVYDLNDGTLAWTHSGLSEPLALLKGGAAAVDNAGRVYIPYSSGEIYVMQAADGRYLWHDALALNVRADPFSALVDVAPPVVVDNVVYAVNNNGRLSAFQANNGRRLWEQAISTTQLPWVAGDYVFIVSQFGQLAALDRYDGSILWVTDLNRRELRLDDGKPSQWLGPVLAGKRLVVVNSQGVAVTVNAATGDFERASQLRHEISVPPIVVDETLLFLTTTGRLVAYR